MSRVATFRGGPFDGRRVPDEMVPWGMFIPREPGDVSPVRTLTIEQVTSVPHYELAAVSDERKLYLWTES